MNKQLKPIPKFANEAEEQAFWDQHDSTDYVDWKKAQRAVLPNLKPTTKTISLRLPQHLLDSIKAAAYSCDVSYQSHIKVWLQEKLHSNRANVTSLVGDVGSQAISILAPECLINIGKEVNLAGRREASVDGYRAVHGADQSVYREDVQGIILNRSMYDCKICRSFYFLPVSVH